MSGGSFNYLAFKDVPEIMSTSCLVELRNMEEWLRSQGKHDAADELFRYRLDLETARRRLTTMHQRLYNVMYEAEMWCSCDHSEEAFEQAWSEFIGVPGRVVQTRRLTEGD